MEKKIGKKDGGRGEKEMEGSWNLNRNCIESVFALVCNVILTILYLSIHELHFIYLGFSVQFLNFFG